MFKPNMFFVPVPVILEISKKISGDAFKVLVVFFYTTRNSLDSNLPYLTLEFLQKMTGLSAKEAIAAINELRKIKQIELIPSVMDEKKYRLSTAIYGGIYA